MVEYYQLAHNMRHAETGRPVAEIIHNFGWQFFIDLDISDYNKKKIEYLKELARNTADGVYL